MPPGNDGTKIDWVKKLDYFFVLRPTLFFPVWTISLSGYWAQQRFAGDPLVFAPMIELGAFDLTYMFIIGLFTMIMGGVFLLNQLADVETDRLNNKLYLVANGDVSKSQALIETSLLFIVPLLPLIKDRPDLVIIMVFALLVTGWFYSCRPLVLKDRPISGALANLLGGIIIFALGWKIKGFMSLDVVKYATPYVLGVLAVYFFTTIPDLKGDLASGKMTVAAKFGPRPAMWAGLVADVLAIGFAVWTRDWVVLLPTLAVLPFFIHAVHKNSVTEVLRTNKFATLFLSLIVCLRFPIYLVLITMLFFFSKWYYKKRFNIVYPSFRT